MSWRMRMKFLFIDIHRVVDRYIFAAGEHALLWVSIALVVALVVVVVVVQAPRVFWRIGIAVTLPIQTAMRIGPKRWRPRVTYKFLATT